VPAPCVHSHVLVPQAAHVTNAARPLSPHLSIYKFRSNMVLSVVFRGTGIAMFAGLAGLSALYLPSGKSSAYYTYQLQQYPALNALVKFGFAFPLAYHFAGGLRHLAWDNVVGHNMVSATKSGYAAAGFAAAVGLAAAFYQKDQE
jgi:succinate dehydrogenase / fumarate reductase cytochrome b subunit